MVHMEMLEVDLGTLGPAELILADTRDPLHLRKVAAILIRGRASNLTHLGTEKMEKIPPGIRDLRMEDLRTQTEEAEATPIDIRTQRRGTTDPILCCRASSLRRFFPL